MKRFGNFRWFTLLMHSAFWLLLFMFPYLLQPSFENGPPRMGKPPEPFLFELFYTTKFVFWIILFYLNAYFLLPQLLYKRRKVMYGLSLLGVLLSLSLIELLYISFGDMPFRLRADGFILFNVFPFLFTLVSSTAYRMYLDKRDADKNQKEKETEHLKTELSFLRSQISPHFMFNVLNNMVSLARKKSDLLEPSLMKLSYLMRYFLYESDEEKVSLEKEIEYLQSYIDLQEQRFGKNLSIEATMQKDSDYQIAPMLLIPFVENAFKHGVGIVGNAVIIILLKAENSVLQFQVANKYSPGGEQAKDKTAGIGLANIQRRLDLLYGENHTLQITKEGGWFKASLQLQLSHASHFAGRLSA
ncbi:MAG: histidine kinase [Williamsia sp.]|nr:histidine kinase [Williamsia sp.]